MKRRIEISALIVLWLFCVTARAQAPASLDPTFGNGGKVSLDVGTWHNEAYAVAVQPDGKILVAGNNRNTQTDAMVVARFTTSGALDPTFAQGGVAAIEFGDDSCSIRAIALQPDGKILLAGAKYIYPTGNDFFVVRFHPNGTLDTSFDNDGWTSTHFTQHNAARSIALQADGKIVVVGQSNRPVDVYEVDVALARYNPDGSPDTSFSDDGKLITQFRASAFAYAVAVQPDGKIIVGGDSRLNANSGHADFSLLRYNADGSLDSTFGTAGKVVTDFNGRHSSGRSLAILPNGQILLGGETIGATSRPDFALACYQPNGALDLSFGTSGKVTTDFNGRYDYIGETSSLAVQPNGKIILAGSIWLTEDNYDFALARYNANGSPDASFGTGGKVITDFGSFGDMITAVTLQADGRIIVVGKSHITFLSGTQLRYADFAVARYMGDLQLSAAASRKSHGTAGTFDVDLPLASAVAVEPRASSGNHRIVITLNKEVTSGGVSLSSGSGTIDGTPAITGKTVSVNLTGVADGQMLTLRLNNMQDDLGRVLPEATVSFQVLVGDTSGNMVVNATDVSQVKSLAGAPVTAANFRADVTLNGSINASDLALVKSRSGATGSSSSRDEEP